MSDDTTSPLWDRLLEKISDLPNPCLFGGSVIKNCIHGAAMILEPSEEILASISASDLEEIMGGFMPTFDEALNSKFPNDSTSMLHLGKPASICTAILNSFIEEHPSILPDVSDANYLKIVSACLAALGTEYLLQAKIDPNQKERYTMMSSVVAAAVAAFQDDVNASVVLEKSRGEDAGLTASFFDTRNGDACNCLKDYDDTFRSDLFALVCSRAFSGKKTEGKDEVMGEVCDHCKQSKEKLFRCKGCQSVRYCGKNCQRADWRNHKPVCNEKK